MSISRTSTFLLGVVVALVCVVGGTWLYLRFGNPPVASADPSFPFEAQIVHVPLNARVDRELQQPPIAVTPAVLVSGAQIYMAQCAACHGTPGRAVAYAPQMFPKAPQLWQKHTHGNVVGVSDDEAGETYWKVANGIRLAGMPAYQKLLSKEEMWQVSLLLKNADQPLPPAVATLLAASPTVPLVSQ